MTKANWQNLETHTPGGVLPVGLFCLCLASSLLATVRINERDSKDVPCPVDCVTSGLVRVVASLIASEVDCCAFDSSFISDTQLAMKFASSARNPLDWNALDQSTCDTVVGIPDPSPSLFASPMCKILFYEENSKQKNAFTLLSQCNGKKLLQLTNCRKHINFIIFKFWKFRQPRSVQA